MKGTGCSKGVAPLPEVRHLAAPVSGKRRKSFPMIGKYFSSGWKTFHRKAERMPIPDVRICCRCESDWGAGRPRPSLSKKMARHPPTMDFPPANGRAGRPSPQCRTCIMKVILSAALSLLLALPAAAQPPATNAPASEEAPARKPGEILWHSDRYLNGEILPGDKIVWHTGEYRDRNVGVACADGEDGLYLEDFGVRVKDVVFTEMPRPGDDDWTAVNAAHAEIEELRRRAADIERIAFHLGDTPSSNRNRVIDFLRELADLERPGLYVSPYIDSGAYIEESRADLLARIVRKEREARGFFQCDLSRLRECILRTVASTADIPRRRPFGGNGPTPLPAAFAAEAGITRYDRTCAEQATALQGILHERDFSCWTLVPRRLPEAAPVLALPRDADSRLDALAAVRNSSLYVGLFVADSSGEIAPRQKILMTPYSSWAADVTNASGNFSVAGTATIKDAHVTGETVLDGKTTVSGDATFANNVTISGTLNVKDTGSFQGYGTIPVGGIIMWSGSYSNIPKGWALCDGNNGTPNLVGKFIKAASSTTIGAKGGN